jgi:hypothetical protein
LNARGFGQVLYVKQNRSAVLKKEKGKKSLLLRSANFLREKLSTRRALREELDVDPGLVF